jgi:hypothetical protein
MKPITGNMNFSDWVRLSLINLLIVAILGVIMRYKIGFSFPFLDQKFLQHGHSHFAFAGWITQTLFILLLHELKSLSGEYATGKYKSVLWLNTITSYGMLISFAMSGYNMVSIFFSTASILVFFLFSVLFFRDMKTSRISSPGFPWIRAGLTFGMLSSLGTFYLAWMMSSSQHIHQNEYLSSVYFYLHFQYNGWFFFACMGTLMSRLHAYKPLDDHWKRLFPMFFYSCIPAYMLSILWLRLPVWLYSIVVVAAVLQFIAWIRFIFLFRRSGSNLFHSLSFTGKYLFWFAAAALTIKFSLQLGSVVPEISKLAFGFRTIVIAYLHLVLLAVITVYLIAYLYNFGLMRNIRQAGNALILFTSGIFLTEFLLLIQGVASFTYIVVPYANEILFVLALVMATGAGMLIKTQVTKHK